MERVPDFGRVMARAAIELRYVAADEAGRTAGLLQLVAMLERAAQLPGTRTATDRGLLDFVERVMSGGRDMLQRF